MLIKSDARMHVATEIEGGIINAPERFKELEH